MDVQSLDAVGQMAGIGGLLLFRDTIRKNIFATLSPVEAYRLLWLTAILVWTTIPASRRVTEDGSSQGAAWHL
jgi:hypothetical protein